MNMPRALKPCSSPGCPELVQRGRCKTHDQAAEQARGNRHQRGYGHQHETRFRKRVLLRDPICTCADQAHGHGPHCYAQSTVADHWPLSRRELVTQGLDPNDPKHGRGLCAACHNRHTAQAQPGGWHARDAR